MYTKPHIEVESVRTALEAMRHAKPLGLAHPLARFLSIRGDAQQATTIAEADTTIFRSLSRLIRQKLNQHRAIVGLSPITSYRDRATLSEDYLQSNTELEAWSLLYYRYVRVDLDLPMDELVRITGQFKRTLNRRQAKGVTRLTQALIRREEWTRARYRQVTLRTQLPLPYVPRLFGHETLLQTALQTLTSSIYPRHLFLYGPPGIGKTLLALVLTHRLIDKVALDNVVWIEQPDSNSEQLFKQIHMALGLPVMPPHDLLSLSSQLQLADTLIVMDNAQTLLSSRETIDTILKTLGASRLLVCMEHPPAHFIDMVHIRIPELDKESALAFLSYEAAKINPGQAENIERFDTLYRQFGGNPGALQAALTTGSRQRLISSEIFQTAWDNSSELSRLVWLVIALTDVRKRSEDTVMEFMHGIHTDAVHLAFAELADGAVLEYDASAPWEISLSALARSFALNVLREPDNYQFVHAAVQRVADQLTEHPAIADSLHLLRTIQGASLPVDLLIDLAYSFAPIVERAGEWLRWTHYLEPLHAATTGEDHLWVGLRLGIARRWLSQWSASAYVLSNVIEEASQLSEFSMQTDAIVELAVVQRHQRMQDTAQKLLVQAGDYYQRTNSVAGLERVAIELSWITLDQHDLAATQSYLSRIVEGKQTGRSSNLAAHFALHTGNLQNALAFAEHAQEVYQGDLPHFARISALLGQIHYELGNSNIAIDYLSSALDIMQHTHDLLGYARARMNLAAVYLGIGNLRKAIDYLRDLPDDLERLGDMDSLQATLKNLELLNRVARHWKSRSA